MANLKEIRGRIESVKSTRQITSAMKMVAASRLRKAQDAIIQLRPYANKLHEIFRHVSASISLDGDSPYVKVRPTEKVLIIMVTSNRGLCGSFNSNVIKETVSLINNKYHTQYLEGNVFIYAIGKKGHDVLKKRDYNIYRFDSSVTDQLDFEKSAVIAGDLMDKYVSEEFDVIELVYNKFKNAAVQILTKEQFLPVKITDEMKEKQELAETDYIFEPSKKEIVEDLIPKSLKIQFYRCLLDSSTSEHGARMTAMHQATDNATDMIRDLQLSYNKARQASITSELIEIVSGASALKG